MKKVMLAVILIFAFCSVAFASIKDSPDGFRKIKWGQSVAALGESVFVTETHGVQMYIKPDEKLKISEADISFITYLFKDKKFIGTMIIADGVENCSLLKTALILRYGSEYVVTEEGLGWMDNNATIVFHYAQGDNNAAAIIARTTNMIDVLNTMKKSVADDF